MGLWERCSGVILGRERGVVEWCRAVGEVWWVHIGLRER
jgi:hypothetical protein